MEIGEYFSILVRRWPILLTFIVLGGVVGYIYAINQPKTFDGVASVSFVKKVVPPEQRTNDFQYDNFYSLESSRITAQLVAGWLSDAAVIAEIYQKAQIELPKDTPLDRYSRLVKVTPLPGATVQIFTNAKSASEAETLAKEAQGIVVDRMNSLIKDGTLDSFQMLTSTPISSLRQLSITMIVAAALFISSLLGIVASFAWDGLRRGR